MLRGHLLCAALLVAIAGCGLPELPRHPAPPPASGAVTQEVLLTIDTTRVGSTLIKEEPSGGVVCAAPCGRQVTVEKDAWYSIVAPETVPSAPFQMYSAEDSEVWLEHDPVSPATKDALRGMLIATGAAGLGLLIAAGALAANAQHADESEQMLMQGLGFSGLILGVPITAALGIALAVHADSDVDFKDPALRGLSF